MHKLTGTQAQALARLVTDLQPGWTHDEVVGALADNRMQADFPAFVQRIVEAAMMGEELSEAFLMKPPHVCPVIIETVAAEPQAARDDAWLNAVVNENDPTASRLLSKPKLDTPAAKAPNDDPSNWRNRFAREIDNGKQQRQRDLLKNRAAEPQGATRCITPSAATLAQALGASVALPTALDAYAQHQDTQGYYPESATAAGAERQGVPTQAPGTPEPELPPASRFVAEPKQETPEEEKARLDREHRRMLHAAAAKREQQLAQERAR
ncbi:hypothetical protein FDH48_gp38 [Arthrobacter phage Jawnski]|uniref:Uncharacterized protein n=1 Tax=Arthrobacter phage Jawnski TaxID=1772327 RepID=A0A0U4KNX1_9CAUD|nr:hypothetical protein FDH48_gp38 [Arthrobacter phage Jawnski]ALY09368.1 hypothetical protein JAWNSKI_38 [Arthrobacter phage Jawnski]